MPTVVLTPAQLVPTMRSLMQQRQGQVAVVAQRIVVQMAKDGERLAEDEEIVASGTYADGFEARPLPFGAMLVNTAPHAEAIEVGRRPGAAGPPWQAISAWMVWKELRGTNRWEIPKSDAARTAIAKKIARSIHGRGLPPHRVMARLAEKWAPVFRRDVESMLRHTNVKETAAPATGFFRRIFQRIFGGR